MCYISNDDVLILTIFCLIINYEIRFLRGELLVLKNYNLHFTTTTTTTTTMYSITYY